MDIRDGSGRKIAIRTVTPMAERGEDYRPRPALPPPLIHAIHDGGRRDSRCVTHMREPSLGTPLTPIRSLFPGTSTSELFSKVFIQPRSRRP